MRIDVSFLGFRSKSHYRHFFTALGFFSDTELQLVLLKSSTRLTETEREANLCEVFRLQRILLKKLNLDDEEEPEVKEIEDFTYPAPLRAV